MVEYLSPKEVAALLGISTASIYRMIKDGRLPHFRVSDGPQGIIRIARTDVNRFIRDRTNTPHTED